MQDFTKPFTLDTKPKADLTAPNLTKQTKSTFLTSRMNKSNFWNLMFGVGMIFGMGLVLKFGKQYPTFSFFCAWTTLIGVPLIIRQFSKVTFTDGKFLTKEGRELNIPGHLPNGFLLVVSTIGTVILVGAVTDNLAKIYPDKIITSIFAPMLLVLLFVIPILFFILKNCPISILFNYQFLKLQNARRRSSYYSGPEYKRCFADGYSRSSSSSSSSSSSWISDPTQSYRAGNIHHSSRY